MTRPGSGSLWRQWPVGFLLLLVAGVPAFYVPALDWIPGQILPGIDWGRVVYFAGLHLVLLAILGQRWYANLLTAATWITLPVVFMGAAITWMGAGLGLAQSNATEAGIHYAGLGLSMLSMVPLSLGLVALMPFSRLENSLLRRPGGISLFQKKMLMVLRVFNHAVFFVIPSLVEVLRQERAMVRQRADLAGRSRWSGFQWSRIKGTLDLVTYLAVESICAAVQFIPLWAYEIGRLPEPRQDRSGSTPGSGSDGTQSSV